MFDFRNYGLISYLGMPVLSSNHLQTIDDSYINLVFR